jgi:transposase-like protein
MRHYPHCPNKTCDYHKKAPKNAGWYRHHGSYYTKVNGRQPRFICNRCGRTFAARTFSIDYYAKRKINYTELLNQQISASGINDMARQFKCTTETVQNRIRRLSHQLQGAMALYLHDHKIQEDLTADGLESFVESQFFPTNINLLVGKKSQFIYFIDSYYFKRKGNMTDKQKEIKEELYEKAHFENRAPSKAFDQLLDHIDSIWDRKVKEKLIFDTDENPIYQGSLKRHRELKKLVELHKLTHRLTNSREERNTNNNLFPCNYCDRMVRKDLAEHVRETVQFARDHNCSMERFTLYQFWLNFMKPYRIKPKDYIVSKTHCEAAKIPSEKREAILKRAFKGYRIDLSKVEEKLTPYSVRLWKNRLPTPTGKLDRDCLSLWLVEGCFGVRSY